MSVITKNLMEDIVEMKLNQILDKLNCCKCETCKNDIRCYSLNRLPPKYVATDHGEILSRIDSLSSSFDISVLAAITSAAEVIKQFPRH